MNNKIPMYIYVTDDKEVWCSIDINELPTSNKLTVILDKDEANKIVEDNSVSITYPHLIKKLINNIINK